MTTTTGTLRDESLLDAFLGAALLHIEGYLDTMDSPLHAAACADDLADHLRHVLVPAFVTSARSEGATWDMVGEALGVARQSAHQRFS